MTLNLCLETCRARGALHAAATGSTCRCLASLPANSNVSFTECANTTCAANDYQLCGDPTAVDSTVKAFVVTGEGERGGGEGRRRGWRERRKGQRRKGRGGE